MTLPCHCRHLSIYTCIKGLEGLTQEEIDAVLAIRDRQRPARQAGPGIRTQHGNVEIRAGAGGDVSFLVNGTSVSVSEIPAAMRSYTDATVDALGT